MTPTDERVKDVADGNSGYIVERCRGRQIVCAHKDDQEIEVLGNWDIESELLV